MITMFFDADAEWSGCVLASLVYVLPQLVHIIQHQYYQQQHHHRPVAKFRRACAQLFPPVFVIEYLNQGG